MLDFGDDPLVFPAHYVLLLCFGPIGLSRDIDKHRANKKAVRFEHLSMNCTKKYIYSRLRENPLIIKAL